MYIFENMKRNIAAGFVVLLMVGTMLSSCSSGRYTFNGKKSKNCGCPSHRGIVG